MKARPSLSGLLSFIPLAGFVWLMMYAYLASQRSGFSPPVYGRPDPTSWAAGYALMGVLLAFIFASPTALPLMLWSSSRRVLRAATSREKLQKWATFLLQLGVYSIGIVLFAIELLKLREWLLD